MTLSAKNWLERYASALGADVPDETDQEILLELAATAAHASERTAAPLACWLAARSGRSPADALEVARKVVGPVPEE